jgi:hypothetical protein
MKKFRVGVFARIDKNYRKNPETLEYGYVEEIVFTAQDWCDDAGIEFYKKEGKICVYLHEFEFDETQITREQVVSGMIEGLQAKQTEVRAEAQKQCTEIDAKINELLCLPAPAESSAGEFAPRRKFDDAEDVYDHGAPDDFPF